MYDSAECSCILAHKMRRITISMVICRIVGVEASTGLSSGDEAASPGSSASGSPATSPGSSTGAKSPGSSLGGSPGGSPGEKKGKLSSFGNAKMQAAEQAQLRIEQQAKTAMNKFKKDSDGKPVSRNASKDAAVLDGKAPRRRAPGEGGARCEL
jgi:hypothetical protein